MPRKQEPTWITAKDAAALLQEKIGRPVNDRYIRRLATSGKIASKDITTHQKIYSKEDVEAFIPSERVGRTRNQASA